MLRKKLRYYSNNRGCRELDIIMGRFAEKFLDAMSESELVLYEAILEIDDVLVYNWIIGKEPVPTQYLNKVMNELLIFCQGGL